MQNSGLLYKILKLLQIVLIRNLTHKIKTLTRSIFLVLSDLILYDFPVAIDDKLLIEWRFILVSVDQLLQGLLLLGLFLQEEGVLDS